MQEIWRDCPGLPGYRVSDAGEVSSPRRSALVHDVDRTSGHHRVTLCHGGVPKRWLVHRLVLLAFVGPAKPGEVCRHLDGNPGNNALSNLAYGSMSDNHQDQFVHGTAPVGEANSQAQIKWSDVDRIRSSKMSATQVVKEYGLSRSQAYRIIWNESWKECHRPTNSQTRFVLR